MMPMNKKTFMATIIIIVLAVSSLAVGYYFLDQSSKQVYFVDISWIAQVNQFLMIAKPYPQWKDDYTLSAYTINLYENGTRTFVNASNGNEFTSYLLGLFLQVNRKLDDSVTDSYVTRMLEADKVVYLRSRLGERLVQSEIDIVWDIYYVLDDNLNEQLKGTIFIEHDVNGTRMWEKWAITK